jgi:hypothetical protein
MAHEWETPEWPTCEKCGGAMWTLKRKPYPGAGVEVQSFTCANCSHLMKRAVDEDVIRAAQH